ncbi:relaxase/mobilization nuclease domain-containing protein [Ascidiaceihabitans sp.]|uniref:relaxase/mobilization nuclease domain-containing protein n=1 Tax=Ascidiaceihabitans sp. TaxID=1872644 RepID=UPI0032974A1C
MILKANQRSHGKRLAQHLLNADENDHVTVHSVHGFVSDDIMGAFLEIEAIAKGTKCRQAFFSFSLSPPSDATVSNAIFEDAAERLAKANGLATQPRVLVFHEKDGRRHAHVVISRIDAATMTAINLPHFKNRLQKLSRELFIEQQWKMPAGLRDRRLKSPTNITLAEWQAAKRRGKNAIDQKALIQQCWASSDSRAGFQSALQDHGYILAKGDRRGHVVVCHDGEVLAVARAIGQKAKAVKERLGDPDNMPTVAMAMASYAKDMRKQFGKMAGEVRAKLSKSRAALEAKPTALIARHRAERALLERSQMRRWHAEAIERKSRFKIGLAGLWQKLSGKHAVIKFENEKHAYDALKRDQAQIRAISEAQLLERRKVEIRRSYLRREAFGLLSEMREERNALIEKLTAPQPIPRKRRRKVQLDHKNACGPDFSP